MQSDGCSLFVAWQEGGLLAAGFVMHATAGCATAAELPCLLAGQSSRMA